MNSTSGPPERQIKSGTDLLHFVEDYPSPMWIYRGQVRTDVSWPLLPKAGRSPFDDPEERQRRMNPEFLNQDLPPKDVACFGDWRNKAIAFSKSVPEKDEFECLAYAQHYGLATRLLDWTSNPLVALFFAVEAHPCHDGADGAVFAYSSYFHIDPKLGILGQIKQWPRVALYIPRPFDARILCQSSQLTFHPEPHVPLLIGGNQGAVKAVIPSDAKGQIQNWLNSWE